MCRFIVRRLLHTALVLLGISFFSFVAIWLVPGDFYSEMILRPGISPEMVALLRKQSGLDQPVWRQYLLWLGKATRGDLGISLTYQMPVSTVIVSRAGSTLLLATVSMALAWIIAIPAGVLAAVYQRSWLDRALTTLSFVGVSIPGFLLAIVFLLLVVRFDIGLPMGGATSIDYVWMGFWERVIDRARHIAIPALALASTRVAGVMRLMRFSLLDTLRQEYVTVARAKGVPEATVVLKHACRNALNPLLSLLGLELGGLFSGAALVECVTGWPGLGKVILAGAWSRDCNLVLGSLMLSSMFLTGGNLLSDILLAVSDPRIYDQTSAYRTTGRAPSHDRDDAMPGENAGRRHARIA